MVRLLFVPVIFATPPRGTRQIASLAELLEMAEVEPGRPEPPNIAEGGVPAPEESKAMTVVDGK